MNRIIWIIASLFLLIIISSCDSTPYHLSKHGTSPFLEVGSSWADSMLYEMTLDEKIGQLVVAQINDRTRSAAIDQMLQRQKISGVIFESVPVDSQWIWQKQWNRISKLPLFRALHPIKNDVHFLHPAALNSLSNDTLYEEVIQKNIQQYLNLDVNLSFLPDIRPVSNTKYGTDTLSLSNKITFVERQIALINTIQKHNILATLQEISYFPQPNNDTLNVIDSLLYPQIMASRFGLSGIVTTADLAIIDTNYNTPKNFITNYLEDSLSYQGLVFSPFNTSLTHIPNLLRLGTDIFLVSATQVYKTNKTIRKAVDNGLVSPLVIDKKVKKILQAKRWINQPKSIVADSLANLPLFTTQDTLKSRLWIEQSIAVVKDDQDILPFTELDKKQFHLIHFGQQEPVTFNNSFNKYAGFQSTHLPNINAFKAEDFIGNNTIVLTFNESNRTKLPTTFLAELEGLTTFSKVVIVNFGNPQLLRSLQSFKTLVQTSAKSNLAKNLTAQALFGGIPTTGQLPITLSKTLPYSTQVKSQTPVRLRYTTPQEMDLDPTFIEKINYHANRAIRKKATPGCQVLVAKSGNVIFHKAYGYHTYNKKIPVTTNDIYDIASITKTAATTLAVMKLVDEGRIDLNARITNYLSDTKKTSFRRKRIKDFLTHQSGLQASMPVLKYIRSGKKYSNYFRRSEKGNFNIKIAKGVYFDSKSQEAIWQEIKKLPRKHRGYKYSDINFNILQRVVETVTEESLDDYIDKQFYAPLGLQKTGYLPLNRFELQNIIPTEYDRKWRRQVVHGYVHDESAALLGGVAGNAGLFASANDLAILFQMLLNKGTYGGKTYLSPETVELFTKSQKGQRGLGFDKSKRKYASAVAASSSEDTFGHLGFTGTCFWVDPQNELIYIFLSNRVYPRRNGRLNDLDTRSEIHEVVYQAIK